MTSVDQWLTAVAAAGDWNSQGMCTVWEMATLFVDIEGTGNKCQPVW